MYPIVLIHGYSDRGDSYRPWVEILSDRGFDVSTILLGNYVSLSNEITIKDIAEGLDRALVREANLKSDEPFDAIVHSTGILVLRAWLASYEQRTLRASRLKHLVALAPASFGSPLAHKGRSWLGAVFKGNRTLGPDFMEAGNEVLDALELGSRFTWDLAHRDLLAGEELEPLFTLGSDSPYVFAFCGTAGYGGLKGFFTNPTGTDGTVRWAGAPLNTRKITLDLTPHSGGSEARFSFSRWGNQDIPLIPLDGVNHGSILRDPPELLVNLVLRALKVTDAASFRDWLSIAAKQYDGKTPHSWQQFVVHLRDERGDPVPDWNIQFFSKKRGGKPIEFDTDVHVYRRDPSFRCFHVDLDELKPNQLERLYLKLIASSGTHLVAYLGPGSQRFGPSGRRRRKTGKWDAQIDITPLLSNKQVKFFYPFTTTLVELVINREPMPTEGRNHVFWFGK